MEEIIEKLTKINKFMETLDNKDKLDFETNVMEQLNKINILTDEIQDKLSTLKLSEEKYTQLELRNRKEKILVKNLFPYYWALNELINLDNNTPKLETI
jgi:glutamine synthetase type III